MVGYASRDRGKFELRPNSLLKALPRPLKSCSHLTFKKTESDIIGWTPHHATIVNGIIPITTNLLVDLFPIAIK